jgi:hypothetical protein
MTHAVQNLSSNSVATYKLTHTSNTGDTTHEAPFHATVSIMLLIHAALKAEHKKTQDKIFFCQHKMTKTHNSRT